MSAATSVVVAQVGSSGYDTADFERHACRHPYRTFDAGKTFTDLMPLFQFYTNRNYRGPRAHDEWVLVAGRVQRGRTFTNSQIKVHEESMNRATTSL